MLSPTTDQQEVAMAFLETNALTRRFGVLAAVCWSGLQTRGLWVAPAIEKPRKRRKPRPFPLGVSDPMNHFGLRSGVRPIHGRCASPGLAIA